jgi:hypothetical protein
MAEYAATGFPPAYIHKNEPIISDQNIDSIDKEEESS